VELVERVGAYVGMAAFLGLAVLALLYFSQARDVRRLRDWAGRAPERTLEQIEQTGQATEVERATEVAPATPAATAATAAAHSLPPTPLSQVSAPKKRKPLRERVRNIHIPQLRYIGMAVLGVLVLAGGAYGAIQLTDGDGDSTSPTRESERGQQGGSSGSGDRERRAGANVNPADVTVAVLNGTTVQGLAAQVGEEVRAGGFKLGTIGNAARIDQATSEVLYRDRESRAARAVANRLGIDKTGPVDSVNEEIAGSFDVIVLVGSDRGG
jgi:LytR cell envelope-related transcriptional attenuator